MATAKTSAVVDAIMARINKAGAKAAGKRAKRLAANVNAVKAALAEHKVAAEFEATPSGNAYKVVLAGDHKVGVVHDGAILIAGRTSDSKVAYVRATAKELAEFASVILANIE